MPRGGGVGGALARSGADSFLTIQVRESFGKSLGFAVTLAVFSEIDWVAAGQVEHPQEAVLNGLLEDDSFSQQQECACVGNNKIPARKGAANKSANDRIIAMPNAGSMCNFEATFCRAVRMTNKVKSP